MKNLKVFIRRFIWIIRTIIPTLIKEFNRKDGYIFCTNFSNDDEGFYRKTLDKLGADYRICDNATDCYERPITGCKALYVRGTFDWDKFHKSYHKYHEEKMNAWRKARCSQCGKVSAT